jgi:hypothetical protein
MTYKRKLAAVALITPLLLGSATATFAQTPGGGITGGTATANRDDDRDTDWSWLGLLGLIGLAGLMPQKRAHDARGTTTTR